MLVRSLLPCVFDTTLMKYCSVSGKTGPKGAGNYKKKDGTLVIYAALNKQGVQSIIGKRQKAYTKARNVF